MNSITDKKRFLEAFSKAWDIYNSIYPSLKEVNYVNWNQMNFYVARNILSNGNKINHYCVCDCGKNQQNNIVQGTFTFKSKSDCEKFIEQMGEEIEFLFTNIYSNA